MKLALVTRRFPPECCGVGDYTERLAESWQRQGHEVIVFVASQGKDGSQKSEVRSQKKTDAEEPKEGIRVVRIGLEGWRDIASAVKAIREARPDAVQIEYSNYGWSRWGFAFWMNALVLALRRAGLPVTIALHEFPLEFRQHPLLAGVSLVQWAHFALLVLGANEVLTNTPERVRILRRWFPWQRDTIRYRPNSSHIPVATCGADERAGLRAAHAAGTELVVATFGMFHSTKHYEGVIEAAGMLCDEAPTALWLLGDEQQTLSSYLEKLHAAVRANHLDGTVWWSGHLEAEEVSAALQAVDIFVLPQPDGHLTRSSAFMAAAAHGLAVIAVRNAENQADFEHGENVWLVEASRAELFSAALRRLAGDAALRARLGSNLRALYEREFAWAVAAAPRGSAVNGAEVESAEIVKPQMNGESRNSKIGKSKDKEPNAETQRTQRSAENGRREIPCPDTKHRDSE
ncbi:MAG: glycosyltransferase family 4 protein [Acidobacteria bacterium]|nr:glycosyltransferase family 4 protein [Acidobacteriota bacterium]